MTMADEIAVMHDGRVEQRGSAEDLYEHPRTAFVANFLGTSNLIPGKVAGAGEFVTEEGARLRFRGEAAGAAAGVRPEKIRLGGVRDGDNVIRGTVVLASYLGTSLQYVVRTAAGAEMTVVAQNAGDPGAAPGAEVELAWRPEHTFIV